MQRAHELFASGQEVRYSTRIVDIPQEIPPALQQYPPPGLSTTQLAKLYRIPAEFPRTIQGYGVRFIGLHYGTFRFYADDKQGFFSLWGHPYLSPLVNDGFRRPLLNAKVCFQLPEFDFELPPDS